MAVITEIDRVCHHYWHFSDPCHPHHEPGAAHSNWRDAISSTYAAIDEAFGEILAMIDEDVPVLVVSDHGFGQGRRNLAVNTLLAEAGLLRTRPGQGGYAAWFSDESRTVDFSRTVAYMPTPGCYAVNLNLVGRQREGIVKRRSAAAVSKEVADLFRDLRDPVGGGKVFADVLPRAEAYPGPMSHHAPDLLLVPADQGVLADAQIGATGPWRSSDQTGMHRYAGMWSYRSPNLPAGRYSEPVALEDLVPTVLHDLGLRQPANVPGRPIGSLIERKPDLLPFLPDSSAPPASHREQATYARDQSTTARTLAAMGYM